MYNENYETLIRQWIDTKSYDLNVIIHKIDVLWWEQKLNDEQKETLFELARNNADYLNSYASETELLKSKIDKIESDIQQIKNKLSIDIPEQPQDEFKPYVQPKGAHDAYYNGAKIIYNTIKYICVAPEGQPCVYNPDAYPLYWEKVNDIL